MAPDRLRFDFTHTKPVKDRDLVQVEDLVNEAVRENITVDPFWTDLDAALKMGAMALFGEKYGNHVRVIRIGDFSTELCGGTHLDATGQIGLFKVTTEGAVASGVRRLEAVTGTAALAHVGREEQALRQAADLLRIPPLELPRRLQKLLDDQKGLEKQLAEMETRLAKGRAQDLVRGRARRGGHPRRGGAARRPRRRRAPCRGRLGAGAPRLGGDVPRRRDRREGEPGERRHEGPDGARPRRQADPGGRARPWAAAAAAGRTSPRPAGRIPPSSIARWRVSTSSSRAPRAADAS